MNANCKLCGFPLVKGNIKVVRPRGKKRPYRIHRRCPEPYSSEMSFEYQSTAGNPVQRPQDSTGGPFTVDMVFQPSEPPRFRYFMTRDQADRVKAAVERNHAFGMGVSFEVIPVPADQVEADPERFADLVEVKVEWKVE
jgi:hypothetical protein